MLDGYVSLKHAFADDEHQRRFRDLIVDTMNRLARSHGREAGEGVSYQGTVGWEEYVWSDDRELAAVDGVVVMTDRGELLGFGGEISGELEPVLSVEKALDAEGETTVVESAESVGTRHRSAYRLAAAVPDALVAVVSQDANVRFVASTWQSPHQGASPYRERNLPVGPSSASVSPPSPGRWRPARP